MRKVTIDARWVVPEGVALGVTDVQRDDLAKLSGDLDDAQRRWWASFWAHGNGFELSPWQARVLYGCVILPSEAHRAFRVTNFS